MIKVVRTNSKHPDFKKLVALLNIDLAKRDGEDYSFFEQFNKIKAIKYVVVIYENDIPLGCGAIKHFKETTMEVKRMYTTEKSRGKGIASRILKELENWAKELSYKNCILETGIRQPEAIGLYLKNGYERVPNYGQYIKIESSRCFKKNIIPEL